MKRCLLIFVLITAIFFSASLTGCSSVTPNKTEYNSMTEEQLCALSDAELIMEIIMRTDSRGNAATDEELLASLNPSVLTAYSVALFDLEVQNGGLCQYFTNSSRYTAQYITDALMQIGAEKTSKLFSEFIVDNNIDVTDLSEFEASTDETYMLNYEAYPFEELDSTFYDNYKTESLETLNAKFIREHISDFMN